ncbi:outer membrane protein [Loktanella agnita]|uniref:outer membrane protein n=1 Tax=Loktanella agnita TaxID=287097 RepID=UPI003989FED3
MTPSLKSLLIYAIVTAPGTAFADWSGGYVGLGVGTATDSEVAPGSNTESFELEGDEAFSMFGGYQVQYGNYVFGGEITFSRADNFGNENLDRINLEPLDFKGRAGYAINNFMLYGAAGPTKLDATFSGLPLAFTGINFGVGADYKFTQQFLIGAEYIARRTSGKFEGEEVEINLDTVTLRAAYKF